MFDRRCSLGVVALAVVFGLLFIFWPKEKLAQLLSVHQFLEAMIPVLAAGALLKYLLSDRL